MADFRNTSYDQEYVVVSRSAGEVVLRPLNASLLDTYWKEFVSAEIVPARGENLLLRLTRLPKALRQLDVNTPYTLDYPQVTLVQGGKEVDLSAMVTANKPSPAMPGLYVIKYTLQLPGIANNVVWESYISIEEPPVLRQAITPWNRDSYTIANLNRLVLEPQFQEALYEEGAPLYNFVTANMSPALRPSSARQCFQCFGYKAGDCLFVSGHRLPLSTTIELDVGPGGSFEVHLDRLALAATWRAGSQYPTGSVVQLGNHTYCSAQAATASDVPGASSKWVEGSLYSLQEAVPPTGAPEGSPEMQATSYYRWTHASDGAVQLLAVWAPVDLRGYIFAVDVKHAPALGTYWGHYDHRYFADYGPGDIVSYISEGVLYLYQRNATDIRGLADEEAYRPGDFRNPHWSEVYAGWEASQLRALGRWIKPISNAGNAIVAKTCSLSEDMCSIYAYILGIPDSVVDAIGSKCSVFLYILLQRTRNTFEGFRSAFRAIGLDVSDLHKVYDTTPAAGAEGEQFDSVYRANDTLKQISAAIHADRLWQPDAESPEGLAPPPLSPEDEGPNWIRYWPNPRAAQATGDSHTYYQIQEYKDGAWSTIYALQGFGDDHSAPEAQDRIKGNNRYYKASLSLLSRLATQALVSMGDEKQWVGLNSFSGISHWVTDAMMYEVPMYIYLTLSVNVASVSAVQLAGQGMRRLHLAAYGGTPTLVVHPTRYFDLASAQLKSLQAQVLVKEDGQWSEVSPTSMRDGSAVYDFDRAVTVRLSFGAGIEVERYWTSRHTMGSLTADSQDASELGGDQELELVNGLVGVTPLCFSSFLKGELSYLKYNYKMDGESWQLDGQEAFGGYSDVEGLEVYATWLAPVSSLVAAITKVADREGHALRYAVQGIGARVLLEVFGSAPEEIYIYGQYGRLVALIRFPEMPDRVDPSDAFTSTGEQAVYRILLDKE